MSLQKQKRPKMTDEEKVRDFQRKIYRKAKQERKFRFYVLYDKLRSLPFLSEAYLRVRANRGAPGVDGTTFKEVEENGLLNFLLDIQEELETKTYRPKPVKRVMIPKANGKMRPLGIPTIKDRVVQMACKMVIEPIFEADFEEDSYGFRPKRSAKQAIEKIKENLKAGKVEVYDADLSAYFDTIPHQKLLILIGKRISDRNIIHLIKLWLKAPVEEEGKMSGGKKNKVGTPQGGVISPLLANIYLHLLDKMIARQRGFEEVSMVRYADDFVLMSKKMKPQIITKTKGLLGRMDLKINEEKTHLINAVKESFDFLGFTMLYGRNPFYKGKYRWDVRPSKKATQKLVANIRENLVKSRNLGAEKTVAKLNPILRDWFNYFSIEKVSDIYPAKRLMQMYLRDRLYRHQRRKSQKYRDVYCQKTFRRWVEKYGLIEPARIGMNGLVKA